MCVLSLGQIDLLSFTVFEWRTFIKDIELHIIIAMSSLTVAVIKTEIVLCSFYIILFIFAL